MINKIITSFIISTLMVGILVGHAYYFCNIGYPSLLEPIGGVLFFVSFIFAIPPAIGFWVLSKIGLAWELRGRESFIELNMALWIYCIIFYTLFIYLIRTLWHKYRSKGKTLKAKPN
jgi:hypothetical protein